MTKRLRPWTLMPSFAALSLIVLSASLLFAAPARAQASWLHNRLDLFAEGGGSFYQGQQEIASAVAVVSAGGSTILSVMTTTATIQDSGRLLLGTDLWFTHHDAVQASYSYSPADLAGTTTVSLGPSEPPVSFTSPLGAHFLSFNYLRSFALGRRWRLLLEAGLGRVWWKATQSTDARFSVNVGTGLSYRIAQHWAFRAEYRDYVEPFPGPGGVMLNNHAPTLGIVFHF